MLTFKKQIERDNHSVFMNFNEFGEIHKVNGNKKLVIVDENELTEREKRVRNRDGIKGEGLHKKQLLFYIEAEKFGPLPSPGNLLNFDGKVYNITDANDEDGIYSISLEAKRS